MYYKKISIVDTNLKISYNQCWNEI